MAVHQLVGGCAREMEGARPARTHVAWPARNIRFEVGFGCVGCVGCVTKMSGCWSGTAGCPCSAPVQNDTYYRPPCHGGRGQILAAAAEKAAASCGDIWPRPPLPARGPAHPVPTPNQLAYS